jgi:hypothetical protein
MTHKDLIFSFHGGSVSGNLDAAGLVGLNYDLIINCRSTSSVTRTSGVGGLVEEAVRCIPRSWQPL